MESVTRRKPEWLKVKLPKGVLPCSVQTSLGQHKLNTICVSGRCPNQAECWGNGTATFMIGGSICTRSCKFCNVTTGRPKPLDENEPENVAKSIEELGIKHAVITSVDRDDLPDGGAAHWVATVAAIKRRTPHVTMELLIPDFRGDLSLVDLIIKMEPDVISHNLETVRRLSDSVRCTAKYQTSLKVLEHIANSGIVAKSGIMLGLGETKEEILHTMDDLLSVGCEVMTIGQYLQPDLNNIPVVEYITPECFNEYYRVARRKGFREVASAPLVRSSYMAHNHIRKSAHL
ncbi:MAG: lipoyl synthase [Bacteroidales bacterium]